MNSKIKVITIMTLMGIFIFAAAPLAFFCDSHACTGKYMQKKTKERSTAAGEKKVYVGEKGKLRAGCTGRKREKGIFVSSAPAVASVGKRSGIFMARKKGVAVIKFGSAKAKKRVARIRVRNKKEHLTLVDGKVVTVNAVNYDLMMCSGGPAADVYVTSACSAKDGWCDSIKGRSGGLSYSYLKTKGDTHNICIDIVDTKNLSCFEDAAAVADKGGYAKDIMALGSDVVIVWTMDGSEPKLGQSPAFGYSQEGEGWSGYQQYRGSVDSSSGEVKIGAKNSMYCHVTFWVKVYKTGRLIRESYTQYEYQR